MENLFECSALRLCLKLAIGKGHCFLDIHLQKYFSATFRIIYLGQDIVLFNFSSPSFPQQYESLSFGFLFYQELKYLICLMGHERIVMHI